jgi:hypothetical protein
MNHQAVYSSKQSGSPHITAILQGFVSHRILYGISIFTIMIAVVEASLLGQVTDLSMVLFFSKPVLLLLLAIIFIGIGLETFRLARAKYKGPLLPALWSKLRDDYFSPQRVANASHTVICFSIFMTGFNAIKALIPYANPFSWDQAFVTLDKQLHFGVHPYIWLKPLFDTPLATYVLNLNYVVWFFVMFYLLLSQGFATQDTKVRRQFLLAFQLSWFLGTCLLGTIFSSVGPGLYARMFPGEIDPYAPLMASLRVANSSYNIYALNVMDELWKSYETGVGMISGISAMPSMHVGTAVLFAILGFASGRPKLGWILTVFASLIFIGSIHLGWHYAVDGYAGIAVAFTGWWLAGKLVNWDQKARAA